MVQVTRPNPSQLLGAQEIAGNRANLILANPAGLHCSGCGAINTDRVTLSTGRPVFSADGSLGGFDVREGNIGIGGQGSCPARRYKARRVLARSININAELWARHSECGCAGANQVDYQTLNAAPQAGNGPAPQARASSASALSSMYSGAGRMLIGTERGVGFHLGGGVTASRGRTSWCGQQRRRAYPCQVAACKPKATALGRRHQHWQRGHHHHAQRPCRKVHAGTTGQQRHAGRRHRSAPAQADRIANSGTIGAGVDADARANRHGHGQLSPRARPSNPSGTIVTGVGRQAVGTHAGPVDRQCHCAQHRQSVGVGRHQPPERTAGSQCRAAQRRAAR
ncbi:two-partner secretion domain-containing protein [Cupriavidus basilensis]